MCGYCTRFASQVPTAGHTLVLGQVTCLPNSVLMMSHYIVTQVFSFLLLVVSFDLFYLDSSAASALMTPIVMFPPGKLS